ncbi:hypothetical protein H8S00_11210 [Eubacterium sp. BX4]|uniref:Mobilization protein n=1 Tax=Eubacterium segne TaxID=2763045 RepID=A0ABR7F4K6_9FIRM|nr:hypothetical protein [Eubacterium segne]MBC5668540.1 hypothetical protein [Eubacterium segne]
MAGLSYSAHLSRKNSAINSKAKLTGVAKHNLRKYRSLEYDKENIVILWGTDKLVQDVKKVYKEQFDDAVREYNKKQTRDDRKIDDYFEKTAKSNKDMAVELIFQIGDKEFGIRILTSEEGWMWHLRKCLTYYRRKHQTLLWQMQ